MARTTARNITYDYADVDHRLDLLSLPGEVQRAVFWLNPEDCVWNPVATGRWIYGPARVEYTRYLDGGINVTVRDL